MNELYLQGLSIDWDLVESNSYARDISALKNLSDMTFSAPITFLVGENGSGKSTLLEAIAIALGFNAEGGTRNYNFKTFDDEYPLSGAINLIKGYRRIRFGYFFRAETFYNAATAAIDYESADYHSNSHGEGSMRFLLFNRPGLYLMDEPEAALSPSRQLELVGHIHSLARRGSQFIIATHSPILLGTPGAQILSFDPDGIVPVEYESTQSYIITKRFLCNRQAVLNTLLEGEE